MNRALHLHPDSEKKSPRRIEVTILRPQPAQLTLRFVLTEDIATIVWPLPSQPTRADGLWRHSCFEAFVGRPDDEAYCEFNFAPSGQWAAYGFERYRAGMHDLAVTAPTIQFSRDENHCALDVTFELPRPFAASLRLALSAVIEIEDGTLSYWALQHAEGKPDFHHRDSFALTMDFP